MRHSFMSYLHRVIDFIKRNKRIIIFVLQVTVSIVLIIFLLRLINVTDMLFLLKNINIYFFIILLALNTFDRFFMAYKWHLLLKVKDNSISFFSVIKTYYIGTLIGFFLPTTVGGDLVRVVVLRSEKKSGSDVLSSVILERMLGFIAGAILASVTAFFLISFFELNVWRFLGIAGIILLLFVIIIVVSFNKKIIDRIDRNERLSGNFLLSKLKKLYLSYAEYKNHKGVLALFLGLSILEQFVPVIGNYLASLALNLEIPFIYFLLIIPIVQLISKVPVSFEGIGINEGLMVYFFGLLGLSKTGAFSIGMLGHFAVIVATLPGIYFYFRDFRPSLARLRSRD